MRWSNKVSPRGDARGHNPANIGRTHLAEEVFDVRRIAYIWAMP